MCWPAMYLLRKREQKDWVLKDSLATNNCLLALSYEWKFWVWLHPGLEIVWSYWWRWNWLCGRKQRCAFRSRRLCDILYLALADQSHFRWKATEQGNSLSFLSISFGEKQYIDKCALTSSNMRLKTMDIHGEGIEWRHVMTVRGASI